MNEQKSWQKDIAERFTQARSLGPSSLSPAPPKPEPVVTPAPVELSVQEHIKLAFDKARQPVVVPKKKRKFDTAQFSSMRARGLSEGEIRSLGYDAQDECEFNKHGEALIKQALELPEIKQQHHVRILHEKSFDIGHLHSVSKAEFAAAVRACLDEGKDSSEQDGKKNKS